MEKLLTLEHVQEIFTEHLVFDLDPPAQEQQLDVVVYSMGLRRGEIWDRTPRIEDGVFASLALCIPLWRQNPRYTEFMQLRRQGWFSGVDSQEASRRARDFFSPALYVLEIYELGPLVNSSVPAEEFPQYFQPPTWYGVT